MKTRSTIVTVLVLLLPLILQASHPQDFTPQPGREFEISRLITKSAPPLGVVRPLAVAGIVAGSATAVCTDSSQGHYFITAAHVVRDATQVELTGFAQAKVLFADHLLDLALLKTDQASAACLTLESTLTLMEAYDPLLLNPIWGQEIHIEALDARQPQGTVSHSIFDSILGSTPYYGLLGHDEAGPLIISSSYGLPGMSGGALMSIDGKTARANTLQIAVARVLRFYGMILATSPDGAKIYALATPIIKARLAEYFSGATQAPDLQVTDAGVIHRAGQIKIHASSLSANRNGMIDAGRLRQGDGSILALAPRNVFTYKDRIWHSIQGQWSEGAALSSQLRGQLLKGKDLPGIFEQEKTLVRSSDRLGPPKLLNLSWSTGKWDLMSIEKAGLGIPQEEGCHQMLGSLKMSSRSVIRTISVAFCEESNGLDQRDFLVLISDPKSKLHLGVRGRLQFKNNQLYQAFEQIDLKTLSDAQAWSHANLIAALRNGVFTVPLTPATSLRTWGLPLDRTRMLQISIEDDGPIEIEIHNQTSFVEIVAPAYVDAFPIGSQLLTSEAQVQSFIQSYLHSLAPLPSAAANIRTSKQNRH